MTAACPQQLPGSRQPSTWTNLLLRRCDVNTDTARIVLMTFFRKNALDALLGDLLCQRSPNTVHIYRAQHLVNKSQVVEVARVFSKVVRPLQADGIQDMEPRLCSLIYDLLRKPI